ncbi:MAG: L-2-keto-3-deoxyarabonate dehydratase [Lentisphaerae bacterium ADurb.Bin242]|nr:MAG: L-2-keto-3-deoxyarabonate dehydratase [Lentisphaerae bacterium ADurb.Bin242]
MEIQGICPIAPAVYDDSGAVDLRDYRNCCEKLIALGAQSLTLFGIAGEYYKLDENEEEALIGETVEVCRKNGAGCIISNTKHSTESALRRAKRIEDSGADCMMVLPPFFLKPGGTALFEHIDALCESVKLPLMFQYAPDQTGVSIAPDLLVKLARKHAHLKYFKIECKPPGAYVSTLKEQLPSGCGIFVGNAGFQMIEGFRRGASGVMPGPSMPDVYRKIWDALLAGDDREAQRVHNKLNALLNHIRQDVEMIIHFEKRILRRRGLIRSDSCRKPGFVSDPVYDRMFEELYTMIQEEFR